jgi:hypothetical protein
MRIGALIEDIEGSLRSQLDSIYVGKTKDVLNNLIRLSFKQDIQKEKNNIFNREGD